ncbi:ABC transporter substrate-binding protein [Halobellus captivus]|uniref:ABC transporter substrate-binding protein n=1 Tax=Halobellus captivus TaxID=2592614 RepID=UPI00119E9A15|nr:ABC transporter substrate-binding protein [Halobellus captivus]
MSEESPQITGGTISRRRALQVLGTTSIAGLAGCGGNSGSSDGGDDSDSGGGDSGGGELGERVATQQFEFWSNLGGTSSMLERVCPIVQSNMQDRMGVEVELVPTEWATNVENFLHDERTASLTLWAHTNNLSRLDPQGLTRRFSADYAGANGQSNTPNWANCEYTYHAVQQGQAPDDETRREHVNSAMEIWSEEMAGVPVFSYLAYGAVNTEQVNPGSIGDAGVLDQNPLALINSEPIDDNQIVYNISSVTVQTTNFPTIDYVPGIWTRLVHSPLVSYDENYELQNVLADSIQTSNEGRQVTVELIDGGTFHNGDPITAEDVQFTFQLMSENATNYPYASSPPYESIEVVDDQTVQFNLEEPYPPLEGNVFARWGILHKDTWEPAMDDPDGFEFDPIIGSGPFEVSNITIGSSMQLTPADSHPVYSPDHDLYLQVYQDTQTIIQAFLAGEIDMAARLSTGTAQRVRDEMGDAGDVVIAGGIANYAVYPQANWGPTKFQEFRAAIGAAIDRQQANELGWRGDSNVELYSCPFTEIHPWRPPEDRLTQMTDDPTGDEELARQHLSEAGWGWDDQGRLHYPPDADLDALWPQGETPSPEDFACVTGENDYNSDYTPS